jgi:hypothetical protein
MEKEQVLDKAKEHLAPLETGNLIDFAQNLTLKSAMEHPLLIGLFLLFAIYAVVARSRFVLLFLFAAISSLLLIRFTLSPEVVGGGLTVSSMLPFLAGGLVIGVALVYLIFIKHD